MDCKHDRFPDSDSVDGSWSFRTFVALYCGLKRRLVHKTFPAEESKLARRERGDGHDLTRDGTQSAAVHVMDGVEDVPDWPDEIVMRYIRKVGGQLSAQKRSLQI